MSNVAHELSLKRWLKGLIDFLSIDELVIAYAAARCGLTKAHACSLIKAARKRRSDILEYDHDKEINEDEILKEAFIFCWESEQWELDNDAHIRLIDRAREYRDLVGIPNPTYDPGTRLDEF